MAFYHKALTRVATSIRADGAQNSQVLYSDSDATATVVAAGYFNEAREKLRVGDIIVATVGIGGTPATLVLRVTAVPGTGNVTVAQAIVVA